MAQNLLPLWRKGNSAMAKIGERVQNSLDEARMLVMGCQILIGVQFEIPFETRFDDLSGSAQALRLIELALLLVALTLILAPAPYHRIVLDGEDSEGLIDGVSRLLCWVLLPLAASLALDVYGSMEGVHGWRIGVTAGAIALVAALVCWYGWELYRRSPARRPRERTMAKSESSSTALTTKVRHVLTEARVVLPGAQALLGFQLLTFLMEGFQDLPDWAKDIHLASLCLVVLSIIFLIAPAAYHRIVEQGEISERLHTIAGRFVIGALVVLGVGLCGDFLVAVLKVTGSTALALTAALLLLILEFALWFGYSYYVRYRRERSPAGRHHAA